MDFRAVLALASDVVITAVLLTSSQALAASTPSAEDESVLTLSGRGDEGDLCAEDEVRRQIFAWSLTLRLSELAAVEEESGCADGCSGSIVGSFALMSLLHDEELESTKVGALDIEDTWESFRNWNKKNQPTGNHPEHYIEARAAEIDCLVCVRYAKSLMPTTLDLAINILDRAMESPKSNGTELMLLCMGSILVASKIEEVDPLSLSQLEYMSAGDASIKEIEDGERVVLASIGFFCLSLNPHDVLDALAKELSLTPEDTSLARYYLLISHHEAQMIGTLPLARAAASLWAAMTHSGLHVAFPDCITTRTGLGQQDLEALKFHEMLVRYNAGTLRAAMNEFAGSKRHHVAMLPEPNHLKEVDCSAISHD